MSRQAFEEWLKTQPPENWWEVSEAEREARALLLMLKPVNDKTK